ncbi:MAG TPA: LuxR family transcriptional regulator [Microbacteriaceae bacterium]|nr:LuxR family transcriptional regulator [Microbacteriaceae bacterium]
MGQTITPVDLEALGDELLTQASQSSSGRATQVFRAVPGGSLSQVMLALSDGRELAEHANPGQALLHVLRGRVSVTAGEDTWELGTHGHMTIPEQRHNLLALEDAVVLLTVVRGGD